MFENRDGLGATLNLVEDLGADPTGEESIHDALAALNTLRGSIRVIVPDGEYRLSAGHHTVSAPGDGTRHIEPAPGAQPTLLVPEGCRGPWLEFTADGSIQGIDIDRSAFDVSPELRISSPNGFRLKDMEVDGRESLPDDAHGNGVLSIAGGKSGTIVVDDFTISGGTTTGRMGGAQPGIVVSPQNRATVKLVDCAIGECSSHGVDAARSPAPVKIHGGTFVDNNRSQLRLCGPGMEVTGAKVGVDIRGSRLPTHDYARTAGIWNEALTDRHEGRPQSGGVISDTAIRVRSGPRGKLYGAYYGSPLAGGMAVRGCDMVVDVGGVPAVRVDAPERVLDDYPPREPLGIEFRRSAFRGQARSGTAVKIEGRPSSSLTDSCIAQPDQREGYSVPRSTEVSNVNTRGRCTGPPTPR